MFNAQPRLKTASGVKNRIIWFESCRQEGSNVEFLFRDVKTDQKTHQATAAAAENTRPLGHRKLHPLVAVLPPGA